MTDMETPAGEGLRRRRGGGREGHARNALPQQPPWAQPRMRYRPTEVVSADELEAIHIGSLRVLSEIGMDFLDAEAREVLRAAGADDRPRARSACGSTRTMVTELIKTAPATFTLHAWNPEHDLELGGDWVAFGTVGSPPNVADLDRGRRIGNRADYQNLLRLGQSLNAVHFLAGYPVEPVDIHHGVRHLHATFDALTLMDKPIHAYSLGRQRNIDALEMVRIARGIDAGDARPRAVDLHGRQLELAAPARRADAPGDHGVLGPQPGRVHHAVHAGRARWRR